MQALADGQHAESGGKMVAGGCVGMGMKFLLCLLPMLCCTLASAADPVRAAVERAHGEIWRRFMDEHGIMLDFTDLDGKVIFPTPEECREGKPNALGWWSPIENGAMFNGLYMDAALLRWQHSKSAEDAEKARKVMRGLLKLNQISEVPGFVGRGVSTDGRSHFPMGSNDQMLPWILGLWRYYESALATEDERATIQQHLVRTLIAVKAKGWRMPAEEPFGIRGTFQGYHFEEAARMLFALKVMHVLTGQQSWADSYAEELQKREKEGSRTKLETCAAGMAYFYAKTHTWTSCTAVGALRALWELESDPARKASYAQGLKASAQLAAECLPLAEQYDASSLAVFDPDWRKSMLPLWKPQATEQDAVDVAHAQLKAFLKTSPRRNMETAFVREPAAAAWIVALSPDVAQRRQHRAAIERMVTRFPYERLYYSTYFWVEAAWWRLQNEALFD